MQKVGSNVDGTIQGGFANIKGGRTNLLMKANPECSNSGTCSGTNADCTNSGTCSNSTNTSGTVVGCSNTGVCFH